MKFLKKLIGSKSKEEKLAFPYKGSDLVLNRESLEKDPDGRIDEFWIETLEVSSDGFWLVVGRRHGVIQLYSWDGKLHRLPSRPPSQVITDAVFKNQHLALLTPPYLVVYKVRDRLNPQSWESFRTTQEGLRASSGLDIDGNLLAYGVVGDRIQVIDLSEVFEGGNVNFVASFSFSNIGQLKKIILQKSNIILSGTEALGIYDLSGKCLKAVQEPVAKAVIYKNSKLIAASGSKLKIYDKELSKLSELELPVEPSAMDLSPDENLLVLADSKRALLCFLDLENLSIIGTLEGFGYSVVRVSQDGTIYTSGVEKLDEKSLYPVLSLSTNLPEFAYGNERLSNVIKNAQQTLKSFKQKLKNNLQEPTEIEEYKKLTSIDLPIREVRKLILEANSLIQDARIQLIRQKIESLINSNALSAQDLSMINTLQKENLSQEQASALRALKEKALSYLRSKLEQKLQDAKRAISLNIFSEQRQIEALEEVKSLREFANTLPKELQQDALKELQRIIQERLINSRFELYRIKKEGEKIYFGQESTKLLNLAPQKLRWKISFQEHIRVSDKVYVKIAFERQDGKILEPRRFSNIFELSEASKSRLLKSYLRHLNGLMGYGDVPKAPEIRFVETPWFVFNLERFVKLVNEQLEYKDGIIILEGDAGVGKNFLIEAFCSLTNRPLFIIPCSGKMEREDVTFLYEFDPKRGTKRVYSELIKALKTPGAVIYFDEINTLPHSVIKMFNPLFDYRRSISLPTGEVFKAHPEVILTGGMNPQNYLGVSELPQDVKSRADIVFMDYPPFESEGLYAPDEAMIMRLNVKELSSLSDMEFVKLWHSKINQIDLGLSFSKEQEERVYELFAILKVATALRKAHRAYQSQQSEEPVQLIFSIRDSMRCARRLGKFKDLRSLLYDSIASKASSPLEKEVIKNLIDSELNELS